MERTGPSRALVCDDDELLRGIVRRMLEDIGYDVIAEVDTTMDAVNILDYTDVELVVLDLALQSGRGEELLAWLGERSSPAKVVVFSAYITDPEGLIAAGTDVLVEKPDFTRLEDVARQLLDAGVAAPPERRRTNRDVPPLPERAASTISGFEPWDSFLAATTALSAGDAILAVDVHPTPALRRIWDTVHELDHRLSIGRVMADSRRPADRISVSPDGCPVLLLVAGRLEAPLAVFDRLQQDWEQAVKVSLPVGVFSHVDADADPSALLGEVLAALRSGSTDIENPLRTL